MLALLYYCLKVIICSGILYGYYLLVLRNNRFHQWNRYYLLAAILLSFTLPFLQIPIPFISNDEQPLVIQGVEMISVTDFYYAAVQKEQHFHITLPLIVSVLYAVVALFFIFLLARNIWKVQRLKRIYTDETLNGIHFYNTQEPGTPFSFFNNIFWNSAIELNTEKGRQMLRHEITHIRENHSVDKLTLELCIAAAWWNPFLFFIRKELSVIHEFIADQKASAGDDKLQYASLLLMKALGSEQFTLGNPFFHSQLKRRLVMLTTIKIPRFSYLRRLMVLPLAVLAVALFSFKYKESQKEKIKNNKQENAVQLLKPVAEAAMAVHGFYQDTTKKKIIIKTEKTYKGKLIESITPTTDKKGVIVKTTDNETYFLNREEAKKELDITITDKGFTAAPGNKVVLTDDNNTSANSYLLADGTHRLNINSLSINMHNPGSPENIDNALVIFDGVELEAAKMQEINVDNIESVDVIKGPAAIAKYGEKGKYGVLIVTTKKALPDNVLYIIDGNTSTKLAMNQLDPSSIISINVWKGEKAVEKFGEQGRNGVIEVFTKPAAITDNLLYIVDGIESTKAEMNKLQDLGNIESVNVLKDEAATKAYGDKGKYGVIIITTKAVISETMPTNMLKEVTIVGYGAKKAGTAATAPTAKLEEITVPGYKPEPKVVFTKTEIMATFPGGPESWRRYLMRNLKYPEVAQKNGTQGTIQVQVVVETDGSLSEVKALNDLGDGLAEEAVRILKQGPKWIPAEQNGRKVTSRFVQTITFKLGSPVS